MDQFNSLRSQLTDCHLLSQTTHLEEATYLHEQIIALQQGFQAQVLCLGATADSGLQPLLVEINRSLRLLAMEVAFWRSSQESLTRRQRQQQLGERLVQLDQLLDMVSQRLEAGGKPSP